MRNWGYYGFSKEDYDSCRHLRDASNLKNAAILSGTALVVELFLVISALFVPRISGYLKLYILITGLTLCLFLLSVARRKHVRAEVVVYGVMTLVYSAGIGISIPSREEKAILFLVLIALLPTLFVDNAWRMTIYFILICAVYCVMAHRVKIQSVAETDIYNVCGFGAVSLIMQYLVNRKILQGFVSRVQNETLLQAYEDVQQELKRQAQTDLMTGLYNRTYFMEQIGFVLSDALQRGESVYLVMVDLDKFKRVNDELGHQEGDRIIIKTAQTVRAHLSGNDIATRLGGDEYMFALVAGNHKDSLESVIEAVSREIHEIQVGPGWCASGSIGVTRVDTDAHSVDELYRMTDAALYEAKHQGGNRIVYAEFAERDGVAQSVRG